MYHSPPMSRYCPSYEYFAHIYDEVMRAVDYPQWAEYVLNLAGEFEFGTQPLLNLACGTGSLETELWERGVREIVSLDASSDMIAVAERKWGRKRRKPTFVRGTLQDFDLGRRFPLITCLYDSVNYLLSEDDVLCFLRQARQHLLPGGGLIFDVTTEHNIMAHFADYTFSETEEDYAYIWGNSYNLAHKLIVSHITIFSREKGDLFRRYDEDHVQKLYPMKTIRELIRESGLEYLNSYHEFTRGAARTESERVHFIARLSEDPAA